MGSISRHIKPLVISSLRADVQTHTKTHTHIHTLCGQDKFVETKCVSACGQHTLGLKILNDISVEHMECLNKDAKKKKDKSCTSRVGMFKTYCMMLDTSAILLHS